MCLLKLILGATCDCLSKLLLKGVMGCLGLLITWRKFFVWIPYINFVINNYLTLNNLRDHEHFQWIIINLLIHSYKGNFKESVWFLDEKSIPSICPLMCWLNGKISISCNCIYMLPGCIIFKAKTKLIYFVQSNFYFKKYVTDCNQIFWDWRRIIVKVIW